MINRVLCSLESDIYLLTLKLNKVCRKIGKSPSRRNYLIVKRFHKPNWTFSSILHENDPEYFIRRLDIMSNVLEISSTSWLLKEN